MHFLKQVLFQISLKFVRNGWLDKPELVQAMAWFEAETKWLPFRRRHFQMPFLEQYSSIGSDNYLKQWWLDYRSIYASLSLNELNKQQVINWTNIGLVHWLCGTRLERVEIKDLFVFMVENTNIS